MAINFEHENSILRSIITSIPKDWTSVRVTSLTEIVSAKGINSTVAALLKKLLRDLKIIEVRGERGGMEYKRNIIDSCIDQAVASMSDQIHYHLGYKDRTFISEDAPIVRKLKEVPEKKSPIAKVDLSRVELNRKFFCVGDIVYLMHDNYPAKGVVKASDSVLDSNGNVEKVTYEISLAPSYTQTVVESKLFPSRTSMLKYLQSLIQGDNESPSSM